MVNFAICDMYIVRAFLVQSLSRESQRVGILKSSRQ